jgi:hypothetical protein
MRICVMFYPEKNSVSFEFFASASTIIGTSYEGTARSKRPLWQVPTGRT